jgi:hypothetical protein
VLHQQDCRAQYLKEVASLRQINRLAAEAQEAKKSAYEAKMGRRKDYYWIKVMTIFGSKY